LHAYLLLRQSRRTVAKAFARARSCPAQTV